MGWVDDMRAKQAKAKAEANGQASDPPETGPEAAQGDERPAGDTDTAGYIDAGLQKQLAILRVARPGTERTRNTTLYVSAKCLGQLAVVDRKWLRRELLDACGPEPEGNGLIEDDGLTQCKKTIWSGFKKADEEGPRDVDLDYFDRINVTEVPLGAFDVADFVDEDDEPTNGHGGLASVTPIGQASSAQAAAADAEAAKRARAFMARLIELEEDFWDRDSLAAVRDAALKKMTPPWGVLACGVARALYLIEPSVQLPGIIGGETSLNWFGALAAKSAGGKSSSGAVAAKLVAGVADENIRSIGSGEGIAGQYRPSSDPASHRTKLMFLCPEIDTLSAMKERNGSITRSTLCNVFMGDPPGLSYVKNAKITPMGAQEYRATLIVGVQPGMARTLLEDFYSGMLQRFQWFPAFDSRITKAKADMNAFVYSLPILTPGRLNRKRVLTAPPCAVDAVQTAAELRGQGLADSIEGHMMLIRLKFAFALAILDERDEITEDDWRLAGIAIEVSNATRAWVEIECQLAEAETARRAAAIAGVARSASEAAKVDEDATQIRNCGRRIHKRLTKGPATRRELQRQAAMPKRWFDAALQTLIAEKVIEPVVTADGKKGFALCLSKP